VDVLPPPAVTAGVTGPGLAEVRRAWPEVLERLRELRKTPWTFVKDNTEPVEVDGDVLTLGVRSARLRDTLVERDDYSGYLQQALLDTVGRRWRIAAVVQPTAAASPPPVAAAPVRAARSSGRRGTRAVPDPAPAASAPPEPSASPARAASSEADIDPDDQVLDDVSGADLLSRELGATVIDVVDDV
jgi:DNA polymerase-3 subunit gamma/tau